MMIVHVVNSSSVWYNHTLFMLLRPTQRSLALHNDDLGNLVGNLIAYIE